MYDSFKQFVQLIVEENSDSCTIESYEETLENEPCFIIKVKEGTGQRFLLSPKIIGELNEGTEEWKELYEMATDWVFDQILKGKNLENSK